MRLQVDHPPARPLLPPGYELRRRTKDDVDQWVDLLNGEGRGELGVWTRERLGNDVLAYLVPETQWFVCRDSRIAAGAGVFERSMACWEVGWVATHPDHRGRGLGAGVVAAAIGSAMALPERPVWLFTDDHRDAAIRLYLRTGFVPDPCDPSHPKRWRTVVKRLGPAYTHFAP